MKIFRFAKNVFFIGLTNLSSYTSVNSLSCISMSNKPCNARPEFIIVYNNNCIFYPLSTGISKCSGSCNNINDLYAKICILDVLDVKDLIVKVFNLMWRTNETKYTKWH